MSFRVFAGQTNQLISQKDVSTTTLNGTEISPGLSDDVQPGDVLVWDGKVWEPKQRNRRILTVFHDQRSSTVFRTLTSFRRMRAITEFSVVASTAPGNATGFSVRVWDNTNSQVVAQKVGLINPAREAVVLDPVQPLPYDIPQGAILELQALGPGYIIDSMEITN